MSTENAHIVNVPTLARLSWTLPWLTTLAISAAIVFALTVFLVAAPSFLTLPADSTPATNKTFTISPACDDTPDNFLLVYARTTGRVPANYCPAAR